MKQAIQYINETLGTNAIATPIQKDGLGKLPMFINEAYKLYNTILLNNELLLVELRNNEELSILQTEKHLQLIKTVFEKKVVLVIENLATYNRKRLIEKGINFIVAGKQLFLPELLIDLKESYTNPRAKQKREKLLPSAQFLLIYHIIHRNKEWKLEEHSFKEIAQELDYTPMAITNAIDNLKYHDIVDVQGEKEKYIRFRLERGELWRTVEQQNLLVNPVLKTVFVDEMPKDVFMLQTNASAMPEYSNLNPSTQQYYAIEKTAFYGLQKSNVLINPNDHEGRYALEVWKYNPLTLVDELPNDMPVVDPLSLYLSLKDSQDERIEMALEQIIEEYIW
jgi:DNA-binding MarR family transcriptional regulator